MSQTPQISLEQWRALLAVVDAGGYAQAAEQLHKSQSAVTYAVQKIESQLGIKAFDLMGRRAVLTATGQMLYRRARSLVEEAQSLERAARAVSAGWEPEVRLAVEILFPNALLFDSLCRFGEESPHTRVEVLETVLGGAPDALLTREADLAISPVVPPGFPGEPLMRLKLVPVAHPDHPLHHLGREPTYHDLSNYRHLVVRDSGTRRDRGALTVEVEQRWTLSHIATSIDAARRGYGFAWLPLARIEEELRAGLLQALPVQEGRERYVELYLVLGDSDSAGPGTRRLMELIRARCAEYEAEQAGVAAPESDTAAASATDGGVVAGE